MDPTLAAVSQPTFASLGELGPHLLDALQHHVAVPVEGLDAAQQLFVVPETENI